MRAGTSVKKAFKELANTPFRNPYNSPGVLRAVLDDALDQLNTLLRQYVLTPALKGQAQWLLIHMGEEIEFRGKRLNHFFTLLISPNPEDPDKLVFTIRAASPDGKALASQMGLLTSGDAPIANVDARVTRVVEV